MSIPPIHMDNPIELADIPEQPLSIMLPAKGRPAPYGHPGSSLHFLCYLHGTIGVFLLVHFSLSPYMANAKWIVSWLIPMEPKLVAMLAFAIAIRPLIRNGAYSIFLVCLGAITAIVSLTTSYWVVPSALSITTVELVCLLGMEVAFHYYVLATACDRTLSKAPADTYRRFNQLSICAFASIVIHLMISSTVSSLLSFWCLAVVGCIVGLHWQCVRERRPMDILKTILVGFFFYPSESELAPGQVASPAGNYISRAILMGTFFSTFVCIATQVVDSGDKSRSLGWFFLSFALIFAILVFIVGMVGHTFQVGSRIEAWRSIIKRMRKSDNPLEKNSLLLGYVAADHSPVLVDRSLLFQHAHVLGATGTNKSSMGLAPLIEQLISFGDASVIVIDLKSDSPELFYAAQAAVKSLRSEQGKDIPLKIFSLENETQSHLFNPFLTSGWTRLSILERTDVICTSCGLSYGFDYGKSFFTSSNSAVLRAANLLNPNAMSFRQLYQDVARLLGSDTDILLPELRKAGVHALEVIGRLASYEGMNIVPESGYDDEVLENQIQLVDYFEKPGVAYFRLPSTTSSIGAPSIARLVLYFLIIASKKANRTTKVHVIIDEFQRMASENLDQMLQMARSHDIGLVLCNQSLSDLRANSPKVFQAVNGNCAIRQWFSITSNDDIDMIIQLMGTHEEAQLSKVYGTETTATFRNEHVPRARITDIHKISENPNLSIIQVGGSGRGYARYKGIPFVAFNDYHISAAEYAIRRGMDWPTGMPGMFTTKEVPPDDPLRVPPKGKPRNAKKGRGDAGLTDNENPEDLFR